MKLFKTSASAWSVTVLGIMAVMGLMSFSAMAGSVEYKVDPGASKVEWLGKKVTGQHNGTIGLKSGSVKFDGPKLVSGNFVIDMATIKNLDLTDAEYNKKLVGHLESDDFFAVQKFKEATLLIRKVKELSPGQVQISGDLAIKGVTRPVTFPAAVKVSADSASASGKILVDRTKYGIRYGSGKFFQNLGDKMISDEFELAFSLNAKK